MKTTLNIISIAILGAIGVGSYLGTRDGIGGPGPDPEPVIEVDTAPAPVPDAAPVVDSIPADPLSEPDGADETVIDPLDGNIVYSVEGTQSGYFIANDEIRFGSLVLENVELWPATPECDEPAYVRLAMEDTADQLGENEYGPYFRLYAMAVDSAAITTDGVLITASDPEIGTLVIEADYAPGALAEWQSGAEYVGELLVGTATLNGDAQPGRFAFWIGD